MKFITALAVTLLFSVTGFSETNCRQSAESHLAFVANNRAFNISDYKMEVSTSSFASEETEVYSFLRSILDSWEIEMVSSDCFLIRIEFIGDL